ncbi:FAD-dependent thymidylate synthase [Helicovermis profundi]|uniref:FAD-dependent thymidylate synthase n=1 Tax=Helicovermis profundi TaxID=3065157 RepID=A0AAU9EDK8_9FIRM|nr:FAD-dependent thymidylate synthase [Clostridia bacterium S502]
MKITNFEDTGLSKVGEYIAENEKVSIFELGEILKTSNISFVLEKINRIQSTLICELKDSYVQQSQRYVNMNNDFYDLPFLDNNDLDESKKIVKKLFDFYFKVSILKENETPKGRPKNEDYKYGIPIEDARYILPLAVNTNISISMSGDKIINFIKLLNNSKYNKIFDNVKNELYKFIPISIVKVIEESVREDCDKVISDYYLENLSKIDNKNEMVLLGSFKNADINVGIGALTSTKNKPPSEVLARWGDKAVDKSKGVVERVLSYGHDSISEQSRTTFGMFCSLVTYHQQIRHRLSENYRENLSNLIIDYDRKIKIPPSIEKSEFLVEFLELAKIVKKFRKYVYDKYGEQESLYFLLNCDKLKLITASNARNDNKIMSERLCLNSQWEIRNLYTKKYFLLNELSSTIYRYGLPSCVYGKCREGKLSCGKSNSVKDMFL